MIIIGACVLFSVLLQPTFQQCLTPSDNRTPNKNGNIGLYTGQQGFSLALLQAINQLSPQENLFFSPYSTYHALLMAYFISANQTENYLKKVLRLDATQDKADIYFAYKFDKFSTERRANASSYEFTNANRIFVDSNVQVRNCIMSRFGDEVRKTDFAVNPEAARVDINKWVETQTHDMIKDLLPPDNIDENTKLVLVNAAYFKGNWENKFDPEATKPEVFYITPSKQTLVDMMHIEGTFNHDVSESLMAHILELPYQGGDISMYILLPPFAKEDGIETVLKRLTVDKFKSIVEEHSLLSRTVHVSLPKFSLEHTIELVPILESLGVGNLFKSDADFSILTGDKTVALGEGIHKARIEVDEKGSKAAAATALFSWRMMGADDVVLEKMGVGDLFENTANFSSLVEGGNITLGNALHKARIEVTEEGTKAAAATVLFSFRSSRPAEPAQFVCNHPFIYVIYDKTQQSVLFTGIFRRPY